MQHNASLDIDGLILTEVDYIVAHACKDPTTIQQALAGCAPRKELPGSQGAHTHNAA